MSLNLYSRHIEIESNYLKKEEREILPPKKFYEEIPLGNNERKVVSLGRRSLEEVLDGKDNRLIVIVGPCSIDSIDAINEYSKNLARLKEDLKDKILVLVRGYIEKPRTISGWKGILLNPNVGSTELDLNNGIRLSRTALIQILSNGLPVASELLNPILSPYIEDLISYASIGARTSESQPHKEFFSGLKMPIGVKNPTSGEIAPAVNSLVAISQETGYIQQNQDGKLVQKISEGNQYGTLILRGGSFGPTYNQQHILKAEALLEKAGLPKRIIVDCSHSNSQKIPEKQIEIAKEVINNRNLGLPITGIMIESYLCHGKGKEYGYSKTDPCLGWDETENLLKELYSML